MALSVTEMNTVSTPLYDKKIVQQAYDSYDFFKYLKDNDKVTISGSTKITFPIRYRRLDHAAAVGWGDQVDFAATETRTQAELEWAPYRSQTLITWEERTKNRGRHQVVKLAEDKSNELKDDMVYRLATDLWATTAVTGHMAPLAAIVDSADTYANIAVADAANWAGKEDASSTTMTRALFHTAVLTAKFGENMPTRHYTTRTILGKYMGLLTADERYVNTKDMNTGPTAVTLFGKPVIDDPYIPAGDWYGLDMDSFELFVQEGEDMWVSEWEDLLVGGYPKSMGKVMTCVLNLVCRRRRTNFKFTALTGT